MAGITNPTDFECRPRYTVRDGQKATVVLERDSQPDGPTLSASLIHLDESGVKVSAGSCIPMGEVVQLRLALEQLDSEFQSAVEVCWARPGKGNDWLMACAFRPQIPKQILDKLVICGLLEQRETIRQNVNLPVTIRWELGEGGKSAKLIDYSDGGFCLGTSYVVEAGQRLSMKIDRPEGRPLEVLAKVQWLLKTPDEHLLGCSLLGGDDIGCLRALDDSC